MNKRDLAELKKNFTDDSGFFTVGNLLTAFIDSEKRVVCREIKSYNVMSADSASVILATLKRVIGGSLGKALVEYRFPNEAYEPEGAETLLYRALNEKLSEESADALIERLVGTYWSEKPYVIIAACCTYSVFSRDKNDERSSESESLFNFLPIAICDIGTGDDGLVYDGESNSIVKKVNLERIVSRVPVCGVLFPAFSEGAADVNSVLAFSKNSRKPNVSLINDFLQCEFVGTPVSERETFAQLISDIAGDELDYTVITTVNEKIEHFIAENNDDPDLPAIDDLRLKSILSDSGVSAERLEAAGEIFRQSVGDTSFTAENLVSKRTTVTTSDVKIIVNKDSEKKLRVATVGGRKCLVIDLDDAAITVNGIETTITE